MRINNNLMAMNTHRQLGIANTGGAKSMEKLSSGYRINRAGDDAAGLAISEKMRGQIRGLNMASKNAQDGISLIQTAEGALDETHSMLQRIRELAVQAANDTNYSLDRTKIEDEIKELTQEITDITTKTEFNKKTLLSGAFSGADKKIYLQVGANEKQGIEFNILNMNAKALGISTDGTGAKTIFSGMNKLSGKAISSGIKAVEDAIETVSKQRSLLGATQNRLEHTIKNLDNASENLQAAESRIRDVDMAKEMMEQTRQNILQQASTAMLAQANQAPQTVLQLLR